MKNSGIEWIGEIPDSWEVERIGTHFSTRNVKVSDSEYAPLSVTKQGILPQLDDVAKTKNNDDRRQVKAGDFVINSRSDRKQSCGVSPLDGSVSLINTVLIHRGNILPCYTKYLLKNYSFAEEFYRWGTGIVADLWSTKWESMKRIMIPIPDKIEQQKIAEILDEKCGKIDKLIENEQKQIEKMKEYKQSVIISAVTKGLDKSAPMKDSGIDWIGKIPESWRLKKLKQICSEPLQYGANANGVLFDDILPRYVRITDILDNTLRQDIQKQSLPLEIAKDYFLRDGDILFARSGGTVGKSFMFREHYGICAFAGYLIRARISKEYVSQYIYYYTLSSCYNEWKNAIFIQSTIQNIGASKYANLDIPIPNYNEQKQIADYLDEKCGKIDEVISIKQRKIEKLQEYKKSLIYEYVTGKKQLAMNN